MGNDRHLAIKFRKKGLSYNQISKKLSIPKSTMHYWSRNLKWSQIIKKRLIKRAIQRATKQMKAIAQANQKRWARWQAMYRKEARKEFKSLKDNSLFIAGINLYWGEGDTKPRRSVRLSNTDPKLIKVFYNFLQEVCQIPKEKIHIRLLLYPDLSFEKCKKFWHRKVNIPLSQMTMVPNYLR